MKKAKLTLILIFCIAVLLGAGSVGKKAAEYFRPKSSVGPMRESNKPMEVEENKDQDLWFFDPEKYEIVYEHGGSRRLYRTFEELEDMIYTLKKIGDLDEDDMNIKIIGRIVDIQDPNEFQKQDGTPGLVRNMEIGDETGIIRTTLWNEDAETPYEVGTPLKLENPRISFRNDQLELTVTGNTKITTPTDDDLKELPSFEELEDILYVSKNIEDLEDDDKNVKIQGQLEDTFGNNILSARCPNCNNRLEQLDDEYVCDYCGEDVEKPRYLLMIPARIEDETGDVSVTFFGKLAENLIGMTTDEAAEIVEDSGDEGVLEGKVEKLAGLGIKLIADVNFDEYNEEIRLNPKKIISTEL